MRESKQYIYCPVCYARLHALSDFYICTNVKLEKPDALTDVCIFSKLVYNHEKKKWVSVFRNDKSGILVIWDTEKVKP